jgi:hypothetical protein
MIINRDKSAIITNINKLKDYEIVHHFSLFNSIITDNGSCDREIMRRQNVAKDVIKHLEPFWSDQNITKATKLELISSFVFSIFISDVESWTIKQNNRTVIDNFEMFCYGKIAQDSSDGTDASIREKLEIQDRLLNKCQRIIVQYFGHIARKEDYCFEKLVLMESRDDNVGGKRPRGRPRTHWYDLVKQILTGFIKKTDKVSLQVTLAKAQDRDWWEKMVQSHCNSLTSSSDHDPQ